MGSRKWVLPLSLAVVLVVCSVCPATSITPGTYSRAETTPATAWGNWTETFGAGGEGQPGCTIITRSNIPGDDLSLKAWTLVAIPSGAPEPADSGFTSTAAAVWMTDGTNSWYETPYAGGRLTLRAWATEWGAVERYYDIEGIVKSYVAGPNAGRSFLMSTGLDPEYSTTSCEFSAWVVETARTTAQHSGDVLSWEVKIADVSPAAVPEPVTMMGLLVCCGAIGGYLRRRSQSV